MCGTYLESLTPKEYVGNKSDTFHPLFKGQECQKDQESGQIIEQRSSQVFSFSDSHFGNFKDLLLLIMWINKSKRA